MTTSYFQLSHEYDMGERSLYFSLSHEALTTLPCSPIELAVTLQFKAEALYDSGLTLDHETLRRFFQRFGAKPCEPMPQAKVMDMYWLRETHAGDWYHEGRFSLIDRAIGEQTVAFLRQEAMDNQLMGELEYVGE